MYPKMTYAKDETGEEILIKDDEFQVMMAWEKPYMEACIKELDPRGDVLEIGFGCGYSANAIQEYPIKSHTIIEYHPVVFEKAKEWAKDKPSVTLIHDTWQNALPSLGRYDTLFFDDYPLEGKEETKRAQKIQKRAAPLLSRGKKLLEKIEKKFSFINELKYKDEDLEYFFMNLEKETSNEGVHFLKFFSKLQKAEQITLKQLEMIHSRLLKEDKITQDDLDKMAKEKLIPSRQLSDRFHTFLEMILKSHIRKGGRISCYIEDPTSKYEDELFLNKVITNPHLAYHEKEIPISVPKHCKYYKSDKALIISIESLS
ncbi:MAG: class I SAM-dependent methyltransferase [Simkaniaceae bacterium]